MLGSVRTPPGAETTGSFQCSQPGHVHSDCESDLSIDVYSKPEQIGKLTNAETLNGENQLAVCTHVYLSRTHSQLTVVV